jgi:membrane protease YdiL (CAAX protease family)
MLMTALMAVAAAVVIALALWRGWHRLDAAPPRPRAFRPIVGLGLFVAMLVAGIAGVQLAHGLTGPPVEGADPSLADQARLSAGAYAGQLLVAVAYVVLLARAGAPAPDRRLGRGRAALLGAVLVVTWWPLVQITSTVTAAIARATSGEPADPIAHQTLRLLQEAPRDAWFALTVASVVVAAPLVEEVLYRGIIQQSLRQMAYPPWAAVAITSAIFALMHVSVADPYAVLPLLVLSLGFGWAYERTGRLLAPIVMHALFNLANIGLALA